MSKYDRKSYAERWVRKMETERTDDINQSVSKSKIYSWDVSVEQDAATFDIDRPHGKPREDWIELYDCGTVQAISQCANNYPTKKVAALNFASYKNPGGGFMNGMYAQEESLCETSTLYSVLKHFETSYYAKNRTELNRGLYGNNILYTPDIWFEHADTQCYCDIITCAAPNWGAARRNGVSPEEVVVSMKNRIDSILTTASLENVEILILGAFGCGVFKNDPHVVASLFNDYLSTEFPMGFGNRFWKVVFAIPDITSKNYREFKNQFINTKE